MKLVLASSNQGKLGELREVLGGGGIDIELHAQSEFGVADAEETGTTFIENALLKARNAAQVRLIRDVCRASVGTADPTALLSDELAAAASKGTQSDLTRSPSYPLLADRPGRRSNWQIVFKGLPLGSPQRSLEPDCKWLFYNTLRRPPVPANPRAHPLLLHGSESRQMPQVWRCALVL